MNSKTLILLLCFISLYACAKLRGDKQAKRISKSFSSSSTFSSFSFSANGKQPQTQISSTYSEEYEDQEGDKKPEIRKYARSYQKKNDQPGLLTQDAASNVEEEEMLLKEAGKDEMKLNPQDLEQFLKEKEKRSSEYKYGLYDDLLKSKAEKILKSK